MFGVPPRVASYRVFDADGKKGKKVEKINGPIRFVSVRREPLWPLTKDDVARGRFPEWAPSEFAALFAGHNCCDVYEITSIEFSYVEENQ